MRKLIILLVSIMLIFVVVGCSVDKEEKTEPVTKVTETEKTEEKEFTNVNWSTIIPDPETFFEGAKVAIIMYDPSAYYQVSEYKDGQWEAYVEAAREMGFTDIKHKSEIDGNKTFYAYDNDHEYYLTVTISGENKLLDITCKLAKQ